MDDLEQRVLYLSHKKHLSHIGSCLTALPLLSSIYEMRAENEPVVLSSGHAALALYVVLEHYEQKDAEALFDKHGVHPNRDIDNGIYASAGSLGHGIGIALGMALADPSRNVYCVISDGECAEGSVWESIRIAADQQVDNLIIIVNANGWGAYGEVETARLQWQMAAFVKGTYPKISFVPTNMDKWPKYLQKQKGHYHVLTDEQYEEVKARG